MRHAFVGLSTIAIVCSFGFTTLVPTRALAINRLAQPDTVSVEVAREQIRREHKSLYSSKKADRDDVLTRTFLEKSKDRAYKSAMRYGFLMEIRELAIKRGDVRQARRMTRRITDRFDVDAIEFMVETLGRFKKITKTRAIARQLSEEHLNLSYVAFESDQYVVAVESATHAVKLAKKAKESGRQNICAAWRKQLKKVVREYEEIANKGSGVDTPEHHTVTGLFYCVHKDNWRRGLSHLTKGADTTLKKLALAERKATETELVKDIKALAGRWKEASADKNKRDPAKIDFLRRALYHSRDALKLSSGLEKDRLTNEVANLEIAIQKIDGIKGRLIAFVRFKSTIELLSAGFKVGNTAEIHIDGKSMFSKAKRGLNVVAFHHGRRVLRDSFDTHFDIKESNRFAGAIGELERGTFVVVAVNDEATKFFNDNAQNALESIGARDGLKGLGYQTSYYCLGMKGLDKGLAVEEGSTNSLTYP